MTQRDPSPRPYTVREFHVSREARDRYQFDERLYALNGNVLFTSFHNARLFAQKMNARRDLINFPERSVRAGQINALGLEDEILHYVLGLYRQQRNEDLLAEMLAYLEAELGEAAVAEALESFVEHFPPLAVYRQEESAEAYLAGETANTPNRHIALEEMLLLTLTNNNPAAMEFSELFDDSVLELQPGYAKLFPHLETFFAEQPPFGPQNQTLLELLRSPVQESPYSLHEQLDYIRTHWASLLGRYLYRLLSSLDFLAEEERLAFGGPGPARVYEFGELEGEPENFSPDQAWMPSVVMVAKNVYVWLDQLSREYERPITRLDQVPDEELDSLRRRGFTALWLIGLWERSEASREIKQMMGNPEAVASAYSLKRYDIAGELGGDPAFENLKARAWQRGIRMASDMVPNHMGIDSDWVIEHPDWFIDLEYPPFPSYTFNGPDLCDDGRVGVYLEDGYYTHSDAAVVFKRVDHWSGATRYIYHGNDGTMMPWNDTAQLNYLLPEVREAVIQTILHVARRSPIIRFDAAMTLTKRHYQRLWFPEPGSGGDIPSRAEHGMTKAAFNAAMPQEFWREVVERVAQEVPDTLLLAEAFWLMEGYFVRTLGMHRVYNSAFMNMMRDEKNAEYRQLIKNTLEFDPRILRRYVNFMNNPDERTAVEQFGKGDKYFGICTLLATMPGLPMFGHGQVEGYAEKYGMEFRRAYWNEQADPYLVERHERQIFPLLHRRYLFAGIEEFYLYDFFTPTGGVDENVFAYSNRVGEERALILYHNRYAETRGWVRVSAAYTERDESGETRLRQKTLAEGLGVSGDAQRYLVFRDTVSGLEYIRNCQEVAERGLYAELHAYQSHVFTDFREVHDEGWYRYGELNDYLQGRGVPSIEEAMHALYLEPVHAPFRMLVSAEAFRWLRESAPLDACTLPGEEDGPEVFIEPALLVQVEHKMRDLLQAIVETGAVATTQADAEEQAALAHQVTRELAVVLGLPAQLQAQMTGEAPEGVTAAVTYLCETWPDDGWLVWGTLFGWLFTHALGDLVDPEEGAEISRSWLDEWLLGKLLENTLRDLDVAEPERQRALATLRLLLSYRSWSMSPRELLEVTPIEWLRRALGQHEVQTYLGINRYQGILWFNKESFEELLWWLLYFTAIQVGTESRAARDLPACDTTLAGVYHLIQALQEAEAASEYQVEKLLEAASSTE